MFYVFVKPGWTITSMISNSFLTITVFIELIGPRLEKKMRLRVFFTLNVVKNTLTWEKMNCTLQISCVLCKIYPNDTQAFLYAFYNPVISSSYRYAINDFQLLLRNIPTNKPIVICADPNFPEANWNTLYSPNETEDKVIEMFEEKCFGELSTSRHVETTSCLLSELSSIRWIRQFFRLTLESPVTEKNH